MFVCPLLNSRRCAFRGVNKCHLYKISDSINSWRNHKKWERGPISCLYFSRISLSLSLSHTHTVAHSMPVRRNSGWWQGRAPQLKPESLQCALRSANNHSKEGKDTVAASLSLNSLTSAQTGTIGSKCNFCPIFWWFWQRWWHRFNHKILVENNNWHPLLFLFSGGKKKKSLRFRAAKTFFFGGITVPEPGLSLFFSFRFIDES